jgi:hypothetical protein
VGLTPPLSRRFNTALESFGFLCGSLPQCYSDGVERDPVIEEYKEHVDRTLLRENLKLTVEQRLRNLMELQKLSEELRRAGRKAR